VSRRVLVRVPASSANLGPGFDCMAAALAPALELEVVDGEPFSFATELAVPAGRENLCVRAFATLHDAGSVGFTMRSQIPLSGGLGSSAAATLAGLAAADALYDLGADLLTLAADIEGHPDNAAAALHGGFVICADGGARRLAPPSGLTALAAVPGEAVDTGRARAALPAEVPLGDAVFNVAHGALLTLGLARGDWDAVAGALADRLHETQRAHLYPRSARLAAGARELGALGGTISGAGPTVLIWCLQENVEAVRGELAERTDGWAEILDTPFVEAGLTVRAL